MRLCRGFERGLSNGLRQTYCLQLCQYGALFEGVGLQYWHICLFVDNALSCARHHNVHKKMHFCVHVITMCTRKRTFVCTTAQCAQEKVF